MKKLLFLLIVAVGIATVAYAVQVDGQAGSKVMTTYNVDSDTFFDVTVPIILVNATRNAPRVYDYLLFTARVNDAVISSEMGGTVDTAIGNTDTVIFKLYATFGSSVDTVSTDTVFPGASGAVDSGFARIEIDEFTQWIGGDSTATVLLRDDAFTFLNDILQLDVVVIDTAGDADTLDWTVQYQYRLVAK